MSSMQDLLEELVKKGGSDLHLSAGSPPKIRLFGVLKDLEDRPALMPAETKELIYSILTEPQIADFERELEIDLSFGLKGLGRFRTNVFWQRGSVGAVLRLIPYDIKGFEELNLPEALCKRLCRLPKGLTPRASPTRSGRSCARTRTS